MKILEKLIRDIKKQLFPYDHESDITRDQSRWEIDSSEYLESWFLEQLRICSGRNGCDRNGKCAHYSYSDQARRNYDICRQVRLMLEDGKIKCKFSDKE